MEIGEPKKTHTNVPQPEELPFITEPATVPTTVPQEEEVPSER